MRRKALTRDHHLYACIINRPSKLLSHINPNHGLKIFLLRILDCEA